MKIIYKGRGKGKTTQLIKMAKNYNGYIVCANKTMCNYILSQAESMNIKINKPLTFYEFIEKKYCGKEIEKFFIDNADELIRWMATVPVEAITITRNEKRIK